MPTLSPQPDVLIVRPWLTVWRFAVAWLVICLLPATGAAQGPVSELSMADYVVQAYGTQGPPPADARWTPLSPSEQVRNDTGDLLQVWFRLRLDNRPATDDWAIMFPRLLSGGEIYLGTTLIGRVEGDSPQVQSNWLRPHYFLLPQEEPSGQLLIRVTSRQPKIGIGPPLIGPVEAIIDRYERRLLVEYGVVFVTIWLMGAGSLLIAAIWFQRRHESLTGLFSLTMLAIGVRSINFVIPILPLDLWPFWRAVFYLGTGYGIVLLCIVTMRLGGLLLPWLERGALVYAGLGALGAILAGPHVLRWETQWLTAFPPLLGFTLLVVAHAAWKRRTWEVISLTGILSLGLLAMIHDYSVKAGLIAFSRTYLGHVISPLVMLGLGAVFVQRYVQTLKRTENINLELEQRIRAREAALHRLFADTQRLTQAQAATDERRRIMQDMHDGFGSQLVSSLAMVEHGKAGTAELSAMLRQCIDDLRLTIDALTPDDGAEHTDLALAFGNLRERMEPRLRASGRELSWRSTGIPDNLQVYPRTALGLLRIAQEAITNALKHAHASRLELELKAEAENVVLRVADNGCGFDPTRAAGGRGLANMKKRARELGGVLVLDSAPAGTEIRLSLPLASLSG